MHFPRPQNTGQLQDSAHPRHTKRTPTEGNATRQEVHTRAHTPVHNHLERAVATKGLDAVRCYAQSLSRLMPTYCGLPSEL